MKKGHRLKSTDIETITSGFNNNVGLIDARLDRIERMLKWLVFDSKLCDEEDWVISKERSEEYENVREQMPDISDILEEKQCHNEHGGTSPIPNSGARNS